MPRQTGTIFVSPDPLPFASIGTVTYTCSHPKPWARITCYDAAASSVGMVTYLSLWDGRNKFQAGPTPSWSGGTARGIAELLYWNGRRFVTIATTEFSVSA